jgi:hypothetical protein
MKQEMTASRRQFLKTSALAGSALVAPTLLRGEPQGTVGGPTLKVGLVGCGGRGTGAAGEALAADKNVVLTAMADVFEDKLKASLETLRAQAPEKVKVEPDHCFIGLDAYQKLIDSGVDVVLLAAPPAFRPQHGGGGQAHLLREAGGDRRPRGALGHGDRRGGPAQEALVGLGAVLAL